MTCPKSPETVANHLDDGLSPVQRAALDAHLVNCQDCREEVAGLDDLLPHLRQWQDQAVPAWDRRSVTRGQRAHRPWFPWLQWAPVMASLALVLAVVFNLELSRDADGFTVAFGGNSADETQLQTLLAALNEQQGERQMQLMNVALADFAESTASSLDDVVTWFERQRQQDLQMLEASFQEMLEREYETVRTMQQLASYVQYTGTVR